MLTFGTVFRTFNASAYSVNFMTSDKNNDGKHFDLPEIL